MQTKEKSRGKDAFCALRHLRRSISQNVKRQIACHIFEKAVENLGSDVDNTEEIIGKYVRKTYGPLLLEMYAKSKFQGEKYNELMMQPKNIKDPKAKKEQKSRRDEITRLIKQEIINSVLLLWGKRDEVNC